MKDKYPLQFFGLIGLIFLSLSLWLGLWTWSTYNIQEELPIGSALLTILFVTLGLFFIFSAFILDSIKILLK